MPGSEHCRSRRLFLAGLGATYAIAFASLWVQIDGLWGGRGILPIESLLGRAREHLGASAWTRLPTLFWISASDGALHAACAAGVLLAVPASLGIAPRPSLAALWLLYLSFASTGDVFLGYQWDALLLETGLLAVLYAPPGLRPGRARASPDAPAARFLLRWLLFRLVFLSGAVKLSSGDPTWADGTALDYHFWTQPLPNRLAVLASRMPSWLQKASVWGMFAIELGSPFLLFGPRRARHLACAAIAALMALITLTGNYGFFTLLSLVLCLAQLDDRSLSRLLPRRGFELLGSAPSEPGTRASKWRRVAAGTAFVMVLLLTTRVFCLRLDLIEAAPAPIEWLARRAAPLESFNSYGLFAVMTTERMEIEIEGSRDGQEWRTYRFRFKPGPLERPPVFAGPHMPRLDWQMWFAALGDWRQARWFLPFAQRLLEGSSAVLGLLAEDPFPEGAPLYLRTTLWRTTFATRGEHRSSGAWWHRELVGPWAPTFTLREGRLSIAY